MRWEASGRSVSTTAFLLVLEAEGVQLLGSMLNEFKTFIAKGNAIDLAVGVVIGAAFGKIVSSLVDDVIMPPLGLILGRVDFSQLYVSLDGKSYETLAMAQAAGAPTLNYGNFITVAINFVILAFVVFLMVRQVNRMRKEAPPAAPAPANPAPAAPAAPAP